MAIAVRIVGRRLAVAQIVDHRRRAALRRDLVDRGHRVARADLAGIDAVVVEVLALQRPRLVADQPVFGDGLRIELDLDLHVLGDREDRRRRILHQHLLGLGQRVDIGGRAVAVLGDRLHHLVVQIAAAEAEHRQEHAALALLLDHPLQIVVVASGRH